MLSRSFCCLVSSTVIFYGHGHDRGSAEFDGLIRSERSGSSHAVQMAPDGSMRLSARVAGAKRARNVESMLDREAGDGSGHLQPAATLELSNGMKSKLSFRSYRLTSAGAPSPGVAVPKKKAVASGDNSTAAEDGSSGLVVNSIYNSPIFWTIVVFGTLLCCVSVCTAFFARSPGGAEADAAPATDGGSSGSTNANDGGAETGASGAGERYEEKELANHPEHLDEDIYGMAITAIVRDAQRFSMKTELFALRANRLAITLLCCAFTMTLQIFLMYSMKHLVTCVSTKEARDTYEAYELGMYGNKLDKMTTTVNGYHRGVATNFNISAFGSLSDDVKESSCQLSLSQPQFFIAILLIWTFVCAADMRKVLSLFTALILKTPTIPLMADSLVETPETGDEALIVVGLTTSIKAFITIFILIPRLIVDGYLLWLGCRWLCGTVGFSDVMQNTVTLEFILLLKDVFYTTMAPQHNKTETRNTLIHSEDDDREDSASSRKRPGAAAFLGAFAWGLLSIVWVLLYIEYFQQVLPEYNWDVHDACKDYLSRFE